MIYMRGDILQVWSLFTGQRGSVAAGWGLRGQTGTLTDVIGIYPKFKSHV